MALGRKRWWWWDSLPVIYLIAGLISPEPVWIYRKRESFQGE